MSSGEKRAVIKSSVKPTASVLSRFSAFIKRTYNEEYEISWEENANLKDGFVLYVGEDIYDWSVEGRLRQFKEHIEKIPESGHSDIISLIKENAKEFKPKVRTEEVGEVITVGDGIAFVRGLKNAQYGEILVFTGGVKGMVLDLREESLGCILFGSDEGISSGDRVIRTEKRAGIPVGEGFLGRVVNALGEPVDAKGDIIAEGYNPVEEDAPGIIDRQPVNRPMETGLLVIDAMFPIGRGQRELIIGDRQTGKTAIAIDTIINQRGKGVICVYVAIGQKTSSVVQIAETLKKHDAMDYSIIVSAPAGESATMQYIAPYAGCAMAEYFMNKGKDVLIIYDDLSKHAIAYRAISLLLERSPGREAYPGDVFYLHSRLLERAAHLSDERGGGSITALPIVETQAGDVSAYIPTNIISITDGQIFLESNLFFSGQRPAVNVGLSVSRVGGDAQTKAMKMSTGSLRLDLAQYREMEVFTQFSGELDESTKEQLVYGEGLMALLRQNQYKPYSQHHMVYLLMAALKKLFVGIPKEEITDKVTEYLAYMDENMAEMSKTIDTRGMISVDDRTLILRKAKGFFEKD